MEPAPRPLALPMPRTYRRAVALLAVGMSAAAAVTGCSDTTAVVVTLLADAVPNEHDATELRATFQLVGKNLERTTLKSNRMPIFLGQPKKAEFAILAEGRSGVATVTVEGYADKRLVSRGTGQVAVKASAITKMTIRMQPADFVVNGTQAGPHTVGDVAGRHIAADASGNFTVVWRAASCDGGPCVRARRFDAQGIAHAGTKTSDGDLEVGSGGVVGTPAVAVSNNGVALFAWQTTSGTIVARTLSPGKPLGTVTTLTTSGQSGVAPDVTALNDDTFAAAWVQADGSGFRVVGARITASGAVATDSPFDIATSSKKPTDLSEVRPAIGGGPDGGFLVAWREFDAGSKKLHGKLVDNSGGLGDATLDIPETQTGTVGAPDISGTATGYVVAWTQEGTPASVRVRRFNTQGAPIAPDYQVNTQASGTVAGAAVGSRHGQNSHILVSWTRTSTSDAEVRGRLLLPSGLPVGSEQPLNTTHQGNQRSVAVAPLGDTRFAAAFQGSAKNVAARVLLPDNLTKDGRIGANCDAESTCKPGFLCLSTATFCRRCTPSCNNANKRCAIGGRCRETTDGAFVCEF